MYNAIAIDHRTILLNLFYIYSFQISIIMHNALHSFIYLNIGCITFDATFILMFYVHTCKSNLYNYFEIFLYNKAVLLFQRLFGTECICGSVLLQIRLLWCVTGKAISLNVLFTYVAKIQGWECLFFVSLSVYRK